MILNDSTIIAAVELQFIKGDTIITAGPQNVFITHIDSIAAIVERIEVRKIGTGALIGAIIATPVGIIIGNEKDSDPSDRNYYYSDNEKGISNKVQYGIVGLGTGAIVGGIIGSSFNTSTERTYELTGWSKTDKLAFIEKFFSYKPSVNAEQTIPSPVISRIALIKKDSAAAEIKKTTTSLSLFLSIGAGFPIGEFGKVNHENTSGLAQTGVSGSLFLNIPNSSRVRFQVGMVYSSHTIDGKPFLSLAPTVSTGKWTLITPMAGMYYRMNRSEKTIIYLSFHLGIMFGSSPEVTMQSGSMTATQKKANGNGIAVKIGAGFIANEKFDLGISYIFGNPKYDITAASGNLLYSQTMSQSTALFITTFGVHL